MISRRLFLAASAAILSRPAWAADWAATVAEAKGQTVYFNAWAGSETINAYIAWAGEQVAARYGITLEHVKIADAAEVVRRVRDEVMAGKQEGSVDLVWINGENFRAMKIDKLLYGPFAEYLPNFKFVQPATQMDFNEPVDGLESPWGMAQLTFFGSIADPPRSMDDLLAFAKSNPGRVTYPAPPDFHGTTFLKQVHAEKPEPWAFLDQLHPHLWRGGKQFPQSQAQMKQMLADGELLMAFTFNPNEPANLVASGELPATTIAWQHEKGTIGNTHFVAIPINARAKAAAQVVADFLLSVEAQARKADPKIWGDPTVLSLPKLSPADAVSFKAATIAFPAPAIPEPDARLVPQIEAEWLRRYGA